MATRAAGPGELFSAEDTAWPRVRCVAGGLLLALGLGGMAGWFPGVRPLSYPIVTWGLLLWLDEWDRWRRGTSLWAGQARHFLGVTIPVSVTFWMLFELLNVFYPQWRYRGPIESPVTQVLFAFASFATVIPLMMSTYWCVGGTRCTPLRPPRVVVPLGVLALLLPVVTDVFLLNQAMWLGPLLVLLPFSRLPACDSRWRSCIHLALGGLLAGFIWECGNHWAATRWEYLILPSWPRLFEMPWPGYLGFMAFEFTALVIYDWQRRIRPSAPMIVLLYAMAMALVVTVRLAFVARGLWIPS